jgi:hypothetical protein
MQKRMALPPNLKEDNRSKTISVESESSSSSSESSSGGKSFNKSSNLVSTIDLTDTQIDSKSDSSSDNEENGKKSTEKRKNNQNDESRWSSESNNNSSEDSSSISSSESEQNPTDPKVIFKLQVAKIKKMDIPIEEKKKLLRQSIRERKLREVEIALNKTKNRSKNKLKNSKKKQKLKQNKSKPKKRDKKAAEKSPTRPRTPKKPNSSSASHHPSKSILSKSSLASLLGARWWYVLPAWPPAGYNYASALATLGLREVKIERFGIEPEVDGKGLRKVMGVEGYEGVFSDGKGGLVDVRPKEGWPTMERFLGMEKEELRRMVVKAMEKQMEECRVDEVRREVEGMLRVLKK